MTSALDITRAVNPPRAAFLDYPLGHTTGKPHQPELQRRILRAALERFESMTAPGSIKLLPFVWSDDETWKQQAFSGADTRTERFDVPQYQYDEDRLKAESGTQAPADSCPVCAQGWGVEPGKNR